MASSSPAAAPAGAPHPKPKGRAPSTEAAETAQTRLLAAQLNRTLEAKGQLEGTEYKRLCAEGLQLSYGESAATLEQAEGKFRAAIACCPRRRDAHSMLGQVLERLNRREDACVSFLRTLDLSIAHDLVWAKAATSVFEHLQLGGGSPAKQGVSWWNDRALKDLSAEVESVIGDDWQATRFRAIILSGSIYPWADWGAIGDRSADELRSAAAGFQVVARQQMQLATTSMQYADAFRESARHYVQLGVTARLRADELDRA